MTAEIFISYAWKDKDQSALGSREQIVNEICSEFEKEGFIVTRDKSHLKYRESIKGFMKRIGRGNYIIAVISDKYLKSEYCMYEAAEMIQYEGFTERVFPIVLEDADIFEFDGQINYLQYWGQRFTQLEEQRKTLQELPLQMTFKLGERLRDLTLITQYVQDFIVTVADMNVLTVEAHRNAEFEQITESIRAKIHAEMGVNISINKSKTLDQKLIKGKVFISYAWGGESDEIANQVDTIFQEKGLTLIRDKQELGYKGNIASFMTDIGQSGAVIVILNEKYLKSQNAMYEFSVIANNLDFFDRIFPIVMPDAKIYDPLSRLEIVQYWEQQIQELDEAMKTVSSANLQGFREEIDSYSTIRNLVASLTSLLKDMNTITPDVWSTSDLSDLYEQVTKRLSKE